MYERFEAHFSVDRDLDDRPSTVASGKPLSSEIAELLLRFGGRSFGRGMYRVAAPSTTLWLARLVAAAFTGFSPQLSCFGYDWLGRLRCGH